MICRSGSFWQALAFNQLDSTNQPQRQRRILNLKQVFVLHLPSIIRLTIIPTSVITRFVHLVEPFVLYPKNLCFALG